MHKLPETSRIPRRQVLAWLGLGALTGASVGCGTILYPERVGQPRVGPLDWKVVALDTLGLLFFFVPGVIAFAVDFYNGTIYLPHYDVPLESYPAAPLSRKVSLPAGAVSLATIEAAVRRETSLALDLQPGTYVTRELKSLDDAAPLAEQLALEVERGTLAVRCQSPR